MMEDEKVQVTILTVGPPEEDRCIERTKSKVMQREYHREFSRDQNLTFTFFLHFKGMSQIVMRYLTPLAISTIYKYSRWHL